MDDPGSGTVANFLDASTHAEIQRLASQGDVLADDGSFEEAIRRYHQAWQLIPDPKNRWEATTWLMGAIGDACFALQSFKQGSDAFRYAISCPGGGENPYLYLRLGQCQFEKSLMDAAAESLTRAYLLDGLTVFADEDPKYLTFLKTKMVIPVEPDSDQTADINTGEV
jgi:tetratricopeptide (TPR) repeat protein